MRTLILTLLLILQLNAFANEWDKSAPSKEKCSDGGQSVMNDCMEKEKETADRAMHEIYGQLKTSLVNPAPLKRAQLAWMKYRDLTCSYEVSELTPSSSLYKYLRNACVVNLTSKRIDDLKFYSQWDCNGCPALK